jgi:hypothetical protein
MMKATFHKSCSCKACRRGRSHISRNLNERRLRRIAKQAIDNGVKREDLEVEIAPISSPYTD